MVLNLDRISVMSSVKKRRLPEQSIKTDRKLRINFLRGTISATCPPNKETTTKGSASANPTKPREKGSLVNEYTCQPTITACIWIAIVIKRRASKYHLKSFI